MSDTGTTEPSPQPDTAAQTPEEPPRRGRGRPRKQQQEPVGPLPPKRPRGRPRGSKNKEPRPTPKKQEPVGGRRPRGRPRKWPQKVPLKAVEGHQGPSREAEEGSSSPEASPSQVPEQEED